MDGFELRVTASNMAAAVAFYRAIGVKFATVPSPEGWAEIVGAFQSTAGTGAALTVVLARGSQAKPDPVSPLQRPRWMGIVSPFKSKPASPAATAVPLTFTPACSITVPFPTPAAAEEAKDAAVSAGGSIVLDFNKGGAIVSDPDGHAHFNLTSHPSKHHHQSQNQQVCAEPAALAEAKEEVPHRPTDAPHPRQQVASGITCSPRRPPKLSPALSPAVRRRRPQPSAEP